MAQSVRVCFVCLGNIVRSPLAENMFRYLVEQAGLERQYEIDSAGTSGWHIGEQPDGRMRQVAASHGFKYSGKARQFSSKDLDEFDWVIAMDASNRTNILRFAKTQAQRAKVRMMREFDPLGAPDDPVPDPYYGGLDGFEEVYRIVERSCQGLLAALESGDLK